MGLFNRAPKTDMREEITQLRGLKDELAEVTADLRVTSRILRQKAELVQARDREQDTGNDNDSR